jgi:hypothetical protein
MTPKEKAKELFDKYAMYLRSNLMYDEEAYEDAKVCALIAIDEILQVDCCDMSEKNFDNHIDYWVAVEKEIEKL